MKTPTQKTMFMLRFMFLCGIFVFFLVAHRAQRTTRTFTSLVQIATLCQKSTDKTVDIVCIRDHIRPFVTDQNITVLLQWMDSFFSKTPLAGSSKTSLCTSGNPVVRHGLLHALGEIAYEKHMHIEQIYSLCQNSCDFGCFHGAFVAMAKQNPNLLTTPEKFCSDLEQKTKGGGLRSCYHVIGHGIAEYFGNNISSMVGTCDRIPRSLWHQDCLEGIMMELLGILTIRHSTIEPTPSALLAFCENFRSLNRQICYETIGVYAYNLLENKATAMRICQEVPVGFQNQCASNLGRFLFYLNLNTVPKFTAACGYMPMPLYASCILTGLRIAQNQKNYGKLKQSICKSVRPEFSQQCSLGP
ncbi:hypothetical protein HY086_03965 [Candidatus Gottesmanbacteria bacterium]|nr:hypothetical protein [Candidatus Gottesmanbacteria bacterium]